MNSFKGIFPILNVEFRSTQQIFVLMKTSCFRLRIQKASIFRRHLQDFWIKTNIFVLVTHLQDIFETYSTRFRDVLQRQLSIKRFALVILLRNLWSGYKVPKGDLFGYTETFKTFIKTFYEVTASTNKNIIAKIGYLKRYCRLNKEEMNE